MIYPTLYSPVLAPLSLSRNAGEKLFAHVLNKPITADMLRSMSRMKNWREVLEAVKQTVIIVMRWQNQLRRKLATETKTGVKRECSFASFS